MKRGLFFAVVVAAAIPNSSQATPVATLVSTQAWVQASDENPMQDIGFFKIRFEVTALDKDVYLRRENPPSSVTILRNGVGMAGPAATSILSALNHLPAENLEGYIRAGESRSFDLTAILAPNTSSVYACQLNRLPWSAEASGQLTWLNLEPPFRSSSIFLHGTPEPCSLALLGVAAPIFLRRRH